MDAPKTKYILLFRPKRAEDHGSFADRIRTRLASAASDARIVDLWICCTTAPPPRSLLPLNKGPLVCASIRAHTDGTKLLENLGLREIDGFAEAYEADEALPLSYRRSWAVGEQTPGICLLTLFHRKPRIEYSTFITRWHDGHTALSLRIHPLWHYNRNVVRRVIAAGGSNKPYDGIVEEHFRRKEDLLNPFRFYGRPHVLILRMITVLIDILGFIDLPRIETYLVRETIIKSGP